MAGQLGRCISLARAWRAKRPAVVNALAAGSTQPLRVLYLYRNLYRVPVQPLKRGKGCTAWRHRSVNLRRGYMIRIPVPDQYGCRGNVVLCHVSSLRTRRRRFVQLGRIFAVSRAAAGIIWQKLQVCSARQARAASSTSGATEATQMQQLVSAPWLQGGSCT